MPEEFDDTKPDLLPIVRNRWMYENLAQQIAGGSGMFRVLGEHYVVLLAYDLPTIILPITVADLDNWGVTFSEALEVSLENLRDRELRGFGQLGDGAYSFEYASKDAYHSSRLLLPELIRGLVVAGDPVALIPNPGGLLIAGSDDPESLARIALLAMDSADGPRELPPIPIRFDGDDWFPWLPEQGHPIYSQFKSFQLAFIGELCHKQREAINKRNDSGATQVNVAGYFAEEDRSTGVPTSYAVWRDDAVTLLPRSDRIIFAESGEGELIGWASWEAVTAVVGSLMNEQDSYPVRYRVQCLPSPEELAAINLNPLET